MAVAGKIVAGCLQMLRKKCKPGVKTIDLDTMADEYIRSYDGVPAFKNYRGFPGSICASPNSTVVHGIPGKFELKRGDIMVAGAKWGKVRALTDDKGKQIKGAGPAYPVEVLGLNGVPEAGDTFYVVETEARAREVAEFRERSRREADASKSSGTSLEQMMAQLQDAEIKDLPVVIKGDVQGSVRPHLGIDRSKGDVIRLDDFLLLLRDVPGTGLRQHEAADAVSPEVAGDETPLPIVRQMPPADDLQTAMFGRAGVEAVQDPLRSVGGDVGGSGDDVVDPLAAGAVGGEGGAVLVEVESP